MTIMRNNNYLGRNNLVSKTKSDSAETQNNIKFNYVRLTGEVAFFIGYWIALYKVYKYLSHLD